MGLLWTLFVSFIQVGLFSVGGGYAAIPLIQEQIVNTHQLMTMSEFTDLITIAEMTLSISINSATFVGSTSLWYDWAIVCTIGAIIPAFIICLALLIFIINIKTFQVFKQY